MWAASSLWKKSLVEYFNCDSSSYMNKLSELIVRGGSINKPLKLEGVKYKRNFAQDGKVILSLFFMSVKSIKTSSVFTLKKERIRIGDECLYSFRVAK